MADDLEDYRDEAYFDRRRRKRLVFDSNLLRESALVLRARKPMVFGPQHTVTESIRAPALGSLMVSPISFGARYRLARSRSKATDASRSPHSASPPIR